VHVVFTLPHTLASLVLHNKKLIYSLLFRASAATLLKIAADPKYLGAEIGFLSVLHTWGQNLLHHPHVHCVIPAGGLSPDHKTWIHPRHCFFLPVKVLSPLFRGKFLDGLEGAFAKGELCLPGALQALVDNKTFRSFSRTLHCHDWVVYAKPPYGGPQHVLNYLARYTHRVAISNHRLLSFADGKVTFRWKDYAHGNRPRLMTLTADEFLRRFPLHTLPRGFVRIRFFGSMANRRRTALLPVCRNLLEVNSQQGPPSSHTTPVEKQSTWLCPLCGGSMVVIQRLTAQQIFLSLLSCRGNTLTLLDNTIFTELSAPLLIHALPVYLATVNKCCKPVEGLTDHRQERDSLCRDVSFGPFLLLPRRQSPPSWQRRSIQNT
jgi:hypothetical protein